MAVLRILRIQNYKAFEDSVFELDGSGLTVVIGNNGSGKTSLWEVLSLLSRLANDWQYRWLEYQFRGRGRTFVGCLPWHDKDREMRFELTFECRGQDQNPSHRVFYRVGWVANPETELPQLSTEEVVIDDDETLLKFNRVENRYWYSRKYKVRWLFPERGYPILLSTVGRQVLANSPISWIKSVFDDIARWGCYRFRVLDLGKDLSDLDISTEPKEALVITGSNLPVVLHTWKEFPERYPFDDLRRWIRILLDRSGLELVDWDVKAESAGGGVWAFVRFRSHLRGDPDGRWFELAYAPDGFKAYFLLTVALLARSPLVAIEEPESHLEPRMLDLVALQLAESAKQRPVIVTTHSPILAQHVPPDQIRVIRSARFEMVPEEVRRSREVLCAWLTDVLQG